MNRLLRIVTAAATLILVTVSHAAAQSARPSATVASRSRAGATVTSPESMKVGSDTTADIVIQREIFSYQGVGRRDPYVSLMTSPEIRPLISDLRLTAIAFDPDGNNSVAILRDMYLKTQYRVKVGQQLGRMRVSGISSKQVQFTIQEYGFNRTERLKVTSDSTTTARNP